MQQALAVFLAVFLAELGDKTQVATLLFASDRSVSPWLVFLAASAALVATTAIAVLAGGLAGRYLAVLPLKPIAGAAFVAIGVWTLWSHYAGASG
jgi:putative Ca2+/H+ antiporter (TMEM165/GDT1 family)